MSARARRPRLVLLPGTVPCPRLTVLVWQRRNRIEAGILRTQPPSVRTQSLTANCAIFRRLRVASRAIIGKVDRQGDGQAIYLGHGCYPDRRAQCCWTAMRTRTVSTGSFAWAASPGWNPRRRSQTPTSATAVSLGRIAGPMHQGRHRAFLLPLLGAGPGVAVRLDTQRLAGQPRNAGGVA